MILTAIVMEANCIAGRFGQKTPNSEKHIQFEHNGYDIELRVTGVGAIRLPEIAGDPPTAIVMAGLAGAPFPNLESATSLLMKPQHGPPKTCPSPGGKFTALEHSSHPLAIKSALYASTGEAAVEMENAACASLPENGARPISVSARSATKPISRLTQPY